MQDLPEVIERAPEVADGSNVSFMAHDFFVPQSVTGADAYLFRWILHNWSDKYCVRILRALVPALKPGARIILNEHILLSDLGGGSQWKEQRLLYVFPLSLLPSNFLPQLTSLCDILVPLI